MSIVNAFVTPDYGLVCADTEGGLEGGPYIEVSKLIPLPHMNAIIAFRGLVLFYMVVVSGAVAASSFDELAMQMPDLLKLASDKATEVVSKLYPMGPITIDDAGCGEVILVGFSHAMDRFVVHHFRRDTLEQGFAIKSNVEYVVSPGWADVDFDLPSIHSHPSKEGMKTLALKQFNLVRERGQEGIATGGRLIFAEIRQSGMTIESVLDFPVRPNIARG